MSNYMNKYHVLPVFTFKFVLFISLYEKIIYCEDSINFIYLINEDITIVIIIQYLEKIPASNSLFVKL